MDKLLQDKNKLCKWVKYDIEKYNRQMMGKLGGLKLIDKTSNLTEEL